MLHSPSESEGEESVRFPQFEENKDNRRPKLTVGLVFADVKVYRKALRQYAVDCGFELSFEKNESDRVTVKCKKSCGWRVHASLLGKSSSFQIKTIKGEPHRCPRIFKNRSANSTYLADRYMQRFVDDPNLSHKSFMTLVRKEVKVYAHRQQLYRAKRKAIEAIQGNVKEQYSKLRNYCKMTLSKNNGSTAVLQIEGPPVYRNPTFKRIFILYGALNKGFLMACRPIIGLDACFLKGKYGGQLMAAIARDGNNQMFPLAVAVVEVESKDSWSWFLQLLVHAIGNIEERRLTFISDRQKDLVESFEQVIPSVDHRFCVRHLYANFKLKFKDPTLKDLMWNAARSYLEEGYNEKMNLIKAISQEAYAWLKKIPPELWCKFKMSPFPKCDMLSNNLCESFNHFIKEAREEPILTMLETLRRQFMCRLQKKREKIAQYKGTICPRIQDKVEKMKEKAMDFETYFSGNGIWEIVSGAKSYVVDLNKHNCSCREWDLTGIPCSHATCAILTEQKFVEDYVSPYYHVSAYKMAYQCTIYPVGDPKLWKVEESEAIMPPPYKKRPGRPKKMRRKGPDEIDNEGRVTKRGSSMSCSNCGETSHNKKTCKKPPMEKPRKQHKVITNVVDTILPTQQFLLKAPSVTTGRGTMRGRGRGRGRGRENGWGRGRGREKNKENGRMNQFNNPNCGIGNWNGIGMATPNNFMPFLPVAEGTSKGIPTKMWTSYTSPSTLPSSYATRYVPNVQIQRQSTRFGDAVFTSQSSRNNFTVTTDIGDAEFGL